MTGDHSPLNEIAFTPAVKAEQVRRGSRDLSGGPSVEGFFRSGVRPQLERFLETVDTAYLATASAAGRPYAQHRGGPAGFIKVVDDETIGFADFPGNRQYITAGNLSENERAFLFLMDYANRRRIKVFGKARMVEDPAMIEQLTDFSYAASAQQALLFTVEAFEANCPQHIPQKIDARLVGAALQSRDERIRALEAELAELRGESGPLRF